MARLEEYRRKRDASRSPEPAGAEPDARAVARDAPRFVVQRHSARRLHYDLRLERDGVLASWAVPKGFPTERGSRRLVVHTEDHPLEYLDFEGEIPAGTYGAGTMDVYDRGTYEVVDEKRNGQLTVRLRGERLHGTWTLVPARLDGDERNWLLVKRDEGARETSSRRYLPMRPTDVERLPTRGRWLFEAAWGGERLVGRLAEGEATLWSARGAPATDAHPAVARALGRGLRTFDCVVDGEVVARGGSSVYVLFDLLELEGMPLLDRPLRERRALLQRLVDPRTAPVRLSEAFADGGALLEAAEAQGLAGVVARRPASTYEPGTRSPDWRLVRTEREEAREAGVDEPRELRRGRRVVTLHRLDQRWWPEEGITKGDTIAYYRAIAPVLLPHLRDRPFTLKRHYHGPRSPFEWVKDVPPEAPDWLPTTAQPARSRGGGPVRYPLVQDELALVWMVDFGCVDLHVWPSRRDRPDRPDFVLFDLDPARAPFADVVRAALLLRTTLDALGLDALVRTSGGDGLHVLVPVARVHTHDEARRFAEVVIGALVRASDGLVSARERSKRRGVHVDTKMNGRAQQVVSAYSVRPLPGAPVATPLAWDELREDLDPRELTMEAVLDRVARLGDLHHPLLHGRQRLASALERLA